MKKEFLKWFHLSLLLVLLLSGCGQTTTEDPFAQSGSPTDIFTLKGTLPANSPEEEMEITLKMAGIYKNIYTSETESADRIIGVVEGIEIKAQDMELAALKMLMEGSEKPYADAWDDISVTIASQQLAKTYGIDVDQEIRDQINWTRVGFTENPQAQQYMKDVIAAFGMTEDEYWDDYQYTLLRNSLLKTYVAEYRLENGMDVIKPEELNRQLTDKEYENKLLL